MHILLPIALEPTQRTAQAAAPADPGPVLELAERLAATPGWRLHTATNNLAVRNGLARLGLPARPLPPADGTPHLAPCAAPLLRRLLDDGALGPEETVCVLDPRNVLLSSDTVRRALERHAQTGLSVLSGHEPADHPVQLRLFHDMLDCDLLCLAERAPRNGAMLTGRPFPLDWSALGVQNPESGRVYLRRGRQTEPLKEFPPAGGCPPSGVFLLCEGRHRARRLLDAGDTSPTLGEPAGFSALRPSHASAAFLLQGENDRRPRLFIRQDLHVKHSVCLLTPYTENGPDSRRALEFPLAGGAWAEILRLGGTAFLAAPLAPEPGPDDLGFLLAVSSLGRAGGRDFSEPLDRANSLWCFSPDGRAMLDRATGEPIHGRQCFPPVLALDGALFVGRAEDCLDLENVLERTRFRLLPLAEPENFKVRNAVDALRIPLLRDERRQTRREACS